MLAAAVVLYAMYGVYLSGVNLVPELPHLDINPFLYTFWGLAVGTAIFRYRLFELTPVAREVLIELLGDAVIVLDVQTRVVDANPEARRIFGWQHAPVGQTADQVLRGWVDRGFLAAVTESTKKETQLTTDSATADYDVTITPLRDRRGRVLGHLIVAHDISLRKEFERRLRDLSLSDELTGLNNRRGFTLLAEQVIVMAGRMKINAVLIYIDLDRLKWINDTLGHATGDLALIETAKILKSAFRSSDILARLGGDEFVVLAAETAENSTDVMLTRLETLVNKSNARAGRKYQLSLSVGTAYLNWEKPVPLASLLEQADQRMYQQKQAKKTRSA
jgi:diguanylate cyclase (GGDEF)-like protein/PAS domain S-box-containing protein